jgi:serine/threonine-protein kinase
MRSIRVRDRQTSKNRGARSLYEEKLLIQHATETNANLPHVIDHFRDGDKKYLVLSWVEGLPLSVYLEKGRKKGKPHFSATDSYRLIVGLVHALRRLHQKDAYHGDLTPRNLIVTRPLRLFLIDFGISWSGARASKRQPVAGTRGYRAPELCKKELVDHRADQFSASVIFYELLTNEKPYDDLGSEIIQDVSAPPPPTPPSKLAKTLWPKLDPVLIRGLALDPKDRYDTTGEWLRALSAASPPEIRPPAQGLLETLIMHAFRKVGALFDRE